VFFVTFVAKQFSGLSGLGTMTETIGYAHPLYCDSLKEFGEPRELPHCGGWVLVRPIPGTPYKDAMGCYPLFACQNWSRLSEDMEHLGSDVVSLVLVMEPFSGVVPSYLEHCFDRVEPFKTHYVTDLRYPLENFIDRDYRRKVRKSLNIMDVEVCRQPAKYLDDWVRLYDNLIRKHNITGIRAFSYKCFEIQMNIPGMVMVLGRCEGEIVGATLILVRDQVAYSHLSAYSNRGYMIKASYGIRWKILSYLGEQGIRYFDNGGAPGIKDDPVNGLTQFKRGWSNDKRTVYLCGRVFDRGKYESLCQRDQIANGDYFPAYRMGKPHALNK
jgi:hypothetical protein